MIIVEKSKDKCFPVIVEFSTGKNNLTKKASIELEEKLHKINLELGAKK